MIRKQEVSEHVWYCAICDKKHREYIRQTDLEHFRKGGWENLEAVGWRVVPMDLNVWPVDVTDDTSLYFCPDHTDAARLMQLSVTVFDVKTPRVEAG